MANNTHDDSEFNAYLQGQSPLSKLYQQTTATGPSAAIDAAILAAAHASVKKRGGPVSPFSYRWMVPTALAAVIVLSVTLVLLSNHEQDSLLPLPVSAPSAVTSEPPAELMTEDRRAKQERARIEKNDTLAGMNTPQLADELKTKRTEPVTTLEQLPATSAGASVAAAPESPAKMAEKPLLQGYAAPSGSGALEKRQAKMKEKSNAALATDADTKPTPGSKGLRNDINPGAVTTKSADTWLNEITVLLKAGKETQARDELKAFRKTYVSFTIDAKRYPEINKLNVLIEQDQQHD